ncbi:hypothetical protein [Vibrio cholerae]|uniref:hypothetical protein n=1 Tax=Vibrio cholerae TaxID=666 RepID=UPI0020819F58|nr:hypothetical protein [Vibrio cholerae]EGQ8442514.1 hypothetical protein [Vibrio cholerae]EGR1312182.1 hypothetical protein [Vibrio cholerae]GIB52562.1 hypothetical protein VCSRO187_3351 [Vibrio cholerae]
MLYEFKQDIKSIPKLFPNFGYSTNVMKRDDIIGYLDARSLVFALEERIEEYETYMRNTLTNLLVEKENQLNDEISTQLQALAIENQTRHEDWIAHANLKLTDAINNWNKRFDSTLIDIKMDLTQKIKHALKDLPNNQTFVDYLTGILIYEADTVLDKINVSYSRSETGTTIIIDGEDVLLSLNTLDVLNQICNSIDV